MNILVIGKGGREHAVVWKLTQSKRIDKIYCAPGNGGIAELAENIDIDVDDFDKLLKFAKDKKIDLTIVGPEDPLVNGIVDLFEKNNLKVFGPSKKGAQLEGSKAWAKEFFLKNNIPTGKAEIFTDFDKANNYLEQINYPIVVKASGLAAGKGVIICQNKKEAKDALKKIIKDRDFGEAGNQVIIEEFLEGKEISVLAFTDGKTVKLMVPACDYKRVDDNDEGLNTGGMGCYSPPGFYSKELGKEALEKVLLPTIKGLQKENIKYKGILYAGLILTKDGMKILEYNCRFGDPETQVILPRLKTDLIDIIEASIEGKLSDLDISWEQGICLSVVLSSGGYPISYKTGKEIKGLDNLDKDIIVFHAGTKKEDEKIFTDGGRVLNITYLGKDMKEAREKIYNNIKKISFNKIHYRTDIGLREIKK